MIKKNREENPFPDNKAKPAYHAPEIIALGELAKGSGQCGTGSGGPLTTGCQAGPGYVLGTCRPGTAGPGSP